MALNKIKATRIGIDGNYHRIIQLNCNYDRLDAYCTIATYVDEVTRLAGGKPIESFKVDLASQFHNAHYSDAEDAMKNISLKEAYKALKKLAVDESNKSDEADPPDERLIFFADAEDA